MYKGGKACLNRAPGPIISVPAVKILLFSKVFCIIFFYAQKFIENFLAREKIRKKFSIVKLLH